MSEGDTGTAATRSSAAIVPQPPATERRPVRPLSNRPQTGQKQRGIYSEYLGQSTGDARLGSTTGPRAHKSKHHANGNSIVKQQTPMAMALNKSPVRGAGAGAAGEGENATADADSLMAAASPSSSSLLLTDTHMRSRLLPKVIVPYQPQPGKPPRRIEIERRKRLYASQNIATLLLAHGIDYARYSLSTDHLSGTPSYLPLELFDDTEYECRLPEQWMALGTVYTRKDTGAVIEEAECDALCGVGQGDEVNADGSIGVQRPWPKDVVLLTAAEKAAAAAGGSLNDDGLGDGQTNIAQVAMANFRKQQEAERKQAAEAACPVTATVVVPGRGLRFGVNGEGHWYPCVVTGYNEKERVFKVCYNDTQEVVSLARVHLYVETEDPVVFARRVANAHATRRALEARIRYSLFVDSMPTDEIQPLDSEQVNRVLLVALNTKKLNQNALDTTSLLHEVNIDYARTMNKIIFDSQLTDASQSSLKSMLGVVDESDPLFCNGNDPRTGQQRVSVQNLMRETGAGALGSGGKPEAAPFLGVVDVAYHDFPKHFSDFCFHSFFTKLEAVAALVKVNLECLRLENMTLFNTGLSKSVRLEEFMQVQQSNVSQLITFLKDKWTVSLKNCIKGSLRDVGKGWFNLQERNREVYMASKLRKFMILVNFIMQDTLRFVVENSTKQYADFLTNATKYVVEVFATNEVVVDLRKDDGKDGKDKVEGDGAQQQPQEELPDGQLRMTSPTLPQSSLFSVDLVLIDKKVQFTHTPAQLLSAPISLFHKALLQLQDIPQLETKVMQHLFWHGNEAMLACVRKEEPWMVEVFASMHAQLSASLAPMDEYLECFAKYQDFINLDVDQYVQDFSSLGCSLDDVREEIQSHAIARDQIKEEIPSRMWLGLVSVNCEQVRFFLANKHKEIINKELTYFATLTKERCDKINIHFRKIEFELSKLPDNVEGLVQMREYISTVPLMIAQQKAPIREVMQSFDMLDQFEFRAHKELYRVQWSTFAWPKTLHSQMLNKIEELDALQAQFLSDMRQGQRDFAQELLEVETKVNSFGQYTDVDQITKFYEKSVVIHDKLDDLAARARAFNSDELLHNLDATDYRNLVKVQKKFEPYYMLWNTAHGWLANHDHWLSDSFITLDSEVVNENVQEYYKTMSKTLKSKCIKDNAGLFRIGTQIKKEVDQFRPYLPLLTALRNPGMRDRHWAVLSERLGFEFAPDESLTLTKVVDELHLQKYLDVIIKVGDTAGKEYQIDSALTKMEDAWKGIEFQLLAFKNTETWIVKGVDEIVQLLDEHVVMTQAMQFSAFKKPFEERITRWSNRLNLVYEVLEEWLQVQQQWMSLQSIFSSPDIHKQLPGEGKQFKLVNKTWRMIMSQVHANPDVLQFCDNPGLLQKVSDMNVKLDMVQKKLSDFLDKKRAAFSRFYFLANEDLLQILSQTQDPTAVQPHLKKCFENIERLEFDDDNLITAMFSSENERMEFVQPVDPNNQNVEFWLGQVETSMRHCVRQALNKSVVEYPTVERKEWVKSHPGQTVLNGSQIHWTMEVEQSLLAEGHRGVTKYHGTLLTQLSSMVELVRSQLSTIQRLIMGALIVLDVHARDVVERLLKDNVSTPNDFAWIMQMRYYMDGFGKKESTADADEDADEGASSGKKRRKKKTAAAVGGVQYPHDQTWVQMVQSRFPYGYEYLGNTLRLVITPLTDRCYMTLMSALQLHLGGAPAGPAGTGKTETVKDLAKSVAKQCVVFNCSDGLNYLAMGKFFKGLASSGAWACFDEFNRIDIEVLSVVAQQIMTIWTAIREGVSHFIFEDTDINLEPTCSVFITMNPGYAGRTELPDNLKALFRPVAMMVPDYAMIAQIMLYSFGFEQAKSLARKMVATFKLSSEQLSAQDHYDYGMRAVKTVITRAGILKREEPKANEEILLLRSLRDVNVPKFLKQDLPLFDGIIADLFPGIEQPNPDYGALLAALILVCQEKGLQPVQAFISKCIQLYETTVVRHGLMLVGPTMGGKTSSMVVLKAAMQKLNAADRMAYAGVESHTLNPKAVTMGQLYGQSDPNTREWTDGILASIVRDCINGTQDMNDLASAAAVKDDKKDDGDEQADAQSAAMAARAGLPNKKWVIFDGPVDALWIENMNTVLDDNKKLCLVSGEILQLTPHMTMVFEVEDLAVASPATVSRCGMVYMEPNSMGFTPHFQSWLEKLDDGVFAGIKPQLNFLFDVFVESAVSFVRKQCHEPVPSVDHNLIYSLLNLITCILQPFVRVEGMPERPVEQRNTLLDHIQEIFLVCLVWSIGATTDASGRKLFDQYVRLLCLENNVNTAPPRTGLLYDYWFDLDTASWQGWMETIPPYKFDDRLTYAELTIPTVDSVRYSYMLNLLHSQHKHVLFTGDTGTGKTVNVMSYLSSLPESQVPLSLTFSAATSANQTEDMLFTRMDKRRQRVYGPPLGKRFIVFVDDLNMPAREKYFAQPPIELLRQWMDHGGWYNRRTLGFVEIVDCTYIAAMGPPGGGRNKVTPRFIRHFNQVAHTDFENESLQLIFETILNNSLVKFAPEIVALSKTIAEATIQIFRTLSRELLPTPSKSHYTFNLRDLSKVFQGVLGASPTYVTTEHSFFRLWIHENQRVFSDRLVCNEDVAYMDKLLGTQLKQHFDVSWADVMPESALLFGDYMAGSGAEHKHYAQVESADAAAAVMNKYLFEEYNEENTPMKLVLFIDAISHISRISRILRQPGGNALLLGVGGSGRQSLTKLATYMAEYELFQIEITKQYGIPEWHEDVKNLLLNAGLKEQPTVFLFSDTQIVNESFLEDVNGILNSGDVPSIYSPEDMDSIFAACKIECQRKNIPATKLNAYGQFVNRVRANLHVVLCMSPMGSAFRTRLRMFPALVNCCTIDWFSDWPLEALTSVAQTSLTETNLQLSDVKAVVDTFTFIHNDVHEHSQQFAAELRRYNYVTPTSYLELLNCFKFLLQEKRAEIGGLRNKLQYGLDTLAQAQETVAQLQIDLRDKQPVLLITQKEVEATMTQIKIDSKDAAITKEKVEKQESEAATKAAECQEIKDEAQIELDRALPMLDQAVECLRELEKSHIDEVRNFKKPPSGVVLTMEAACIMLKTRLKLKIVTKADPNKLGKSVSDYWETAQRYLLKDPKTLLLTLQTYDRDNIDEKIIRKIEPYIKMPEFTVKRIESASFACRAICMWVHAMYNYHQVAKQVEPLRVRLRAAEAQLAIVMEALNEAKATLAAVEGRIQALTDKYDKSVLAKEELENDVEMCQVKLDRANKLISGLSGEKDRWTSTIATLDVDYDHIVGDVIISASTIAYLGAFTSSYRLDMVSGWRRKLVDQNISHTDKCDVIRTLSDPVQLRAWAIAGLPTDTVSVENGIIMSKARRWPLMVDPQGQASKFIRSLGQQKFPEDGMDVLKLNDDRFLQSMENAIRFGKWVLVDNVAETLDPALEPLLQQNIIAQNGQPHIKLGDNNIPYNDEFHVYFTTKLPNPHYAPELQVKVTLLNFTITQEGLEDQMLGTVVAKESPELEQKKNALVVQNARMKKQLQEIEDQILKLLSESTGDILDDEELITTLGKSKRTSSDIAVRVAETEVVEKDIDASRAMYKPVALRASLLYFCIADLALVDPMYQYSLQWFVQLFVLGIGNAPMSSDQQERLKFLNAYFTKSLYDNVCRSLFESHKLLFSFLLTIKIMQGDGRIDAAEWRWLIAGGVTKSEEVNPAPRWLRSDVWTSILSLNDLPRFDGFAANFVQEIEHYEKYYDSADPQFFKLPDPWDFQLDNFQKLLVLKSLRKDKCIPAIMDFVSGTMGQEFIDAPQFNLDYSFKDSSCVTPLIFILSRGADPASALFQFASEQGYRDKIDSISLGQGQGAVAQKHIDVAMKKGSWVLLQNCHLALSWLPTLEKIVEELSPEEVHPEFRLWLTSRPTNKFPVSILQNGVKMTNEPPKGLRANLLRTYSGFTEQQMSKSKKPRAFKKLLFALCFFHAVILDRRKFGPFGWNIPYEFTENDLQVCVTQLRDFIDMYDAIPYQVIHFLTYDVNYGGRVTDDVDRRTMKVILDDYINPEVMKDHYAFSASGRYLSIAPGTREHYINYITAMDIQPQPEVFGMHDNADITSAQEQSSLLFSTVLALLPRAANSSGMTRDEVLLQTCAMIAKKTPPLFDLEYVRKTYPTTYSECMNTVLLQEAIRYNKLLARMHQSLRDLARGIKGEMVMTESLESMADSLFNNLVPVFWEAVAYPSLMPLAAWTDDLLARIAFINTWVAAGVPVVFWISGFFFPQAFLTGTLQNFARKTRKPIDAISFGFHVHDRPHDQISVKPEDGVYIHGLFLEGARWDPVEGSIVDSRPKELFTPMPVMLLLPEIERVVPETGVYKCPVYKILTRRGTLSTTGHSTNFVLYIEIPTVVSQKKWIKAGVALFCALRY